jgi:hypothetical protein
MAVYRCQDKGLCQHALLLARLRPELTADPAWRLLMTGTGRSPVPWDASSHPSPGLANCQLFEPGTWTIPSIDIFVDSFSEPLLAQQGECVSCR